ncbi:RNA ligase family protein [Aliikangiella sp. IMCC44359]|uniref:RNA ligase family protein n=1 Tax=Aliikangiella sp. IMCC44359 TaxID=3459125 RepID=UPI00403B1724
MFIKYPKTKHICDYIEQYSSLNKLLDNGQILVVEEKMDGTQIGICFNTEGDFQIQSRGGYISNEPEFSLLKQWVWEHHIDLFKLLSCRYILFGEWLYAKHTMYYDLLPDYFMEFDLFDREQQLFLNTVERKKLLNDFSFISSVRVIDYLEKPTLKMLNTMLGKSAFISEDAFNQIDKAETTQTDITGLMEGLYLKIEDCSKVISRYKLVRAEFIQKIIDSKSHWKQRAFRTNQLAQNRST